MLAYETIAAAYIRSETPLQMTTRQVPEIFQTPLDDLDPVGLPPRCTPAFEQAVIGRYALDYGSARVAGRGGGR